jgi:hypothetical protein
MSKIIRLTENDLARIVKRVIMEQNVKSNTTPPLKTIVFRDSSLKNTRTNIDIVPNSIRLVSNNVIFNYRVAGANTKSYTGTFYCSTNNQIMLNGNSGGNSLSFISSKRAATLKSKCAVNQGYASTNTGVDTTLA